MQLVMLETNGNQRYIFSAPRLRDNIGASAQLVRLKEWTDDALRTTGAAKRWEESHPQPRGGPDPTTELRATGSAPSECPAPSLIGRRRVGKECRSRWSPYH